MSLARTLSEKDFEVLAVDIDKNLVNEAAVFATDAICINATDEISLAKLSPKERDLIICAISSKEASILIVALLKQMGCENVVARTTDQIHSKILKAIGANCIINPDEEYGKKFANKILFENVFSKNNFDNIELREIKVLPFMVGKSLYELKLSTKYGLHVVAISKDKEFVKPQIDEKLEKDQIMYIVGMDEEFKKMIE